MKQKPKVDLTLRNRLIIIVALGLLLVGIYIRVFAHKEEHCVARTYPEGTAPLTSEEPICFRTQAEAIAYATNGRIVLPPNASQNEIDYALRNQTP
jgi:hypothetical protein